MTTRAPSVEEGVERVVTRVLLCGTVQEDAVRTDAMLEAEQLPAGISCLDTGLTHVDGDALSLNRKKKCGSYDDCQSKTTPVVHFLNIYVSFMVFKN